MADSQDVSAPWPAASKTYFDWMLSRWPDRDTVRDVLDAVHRRSAGPAPVVNVTLPGVPGHFTGAAGQGTAAYVPEAPNPLA